MDCFRKIPSERYNGWFDSSFCDGEKREEVQRAIPLPIEIVQRIFLFLSLYDLCQVTVTCKNWKATIAYPPRAIFLKGIAKGEELCKSIIGIWNEVWGNGKREVENHLCSAFTLPFYKALFTIAMQEKKTSLRNLEGYFFEGATLTSPHSQLAYSMVLYERSCATKRPIRKKNLEKRAHDSSSRAAIQGLAEAMEVVGRQYGTGLWNRAKNFGTAIGYLNPLVDRGIVSATYWAATIYEKNEKIDQFIREEHAAKLYKKAADGGHAKSQYIVGIGYQLGTLFKTDLKSAQEYLGKACLQNEVNALIWMGHNHANGSGYYIRDYEKAHSYFMRAEPKDDKACFHLIKFYICGLGVKRDVKEAARYFQALLSLSIKGWFYDYYVGRCYWEGWGVEQDEQKAVEYFEKGTSGIDASLFIAIYYEKKQEMEMAIAHYKRASQANQPQAEFRLCKAFHYGEGTAASAVQASFFFKKLLCNEKLFRPGERHGNISICYREGIGVEKDDLKAEYHHLLSAKLGYAKAQFELCKKYAHSGEKELSYAYFTLLSTPNHPEQEHDIVKRYQWIGTCYQEGLGVEKEEEKASYYLNLASSIIK